MPVSRSLTLVDLPSRPIAALAAVVAGALAVALGAQVAVPMPGTPVPMTFQVPLVLIVGGLLGPRLGAASMALYLVAGALGLPVFAPAGAPGLVRLIGPTGGYLLAFPVAAALVGAVVTAPVRAGRLGLGLVGGLAAIHLAGVAQLVVLTGAWTGAVALGSLPFLLGDVLKLMLAGLVLWQLVPKTRARL